MNSIEMSLAGQDLRLEGELKVTTTDSLLFHLAPLFLNFQQKHPEVELQLLSDARSLDLMQRDADIALRPTLNPPEHWVGRKLKPIATAIYACPEYCAAVPVTAQRRWIILDDGLYRSPMSQIARSRKPKDALVTVVNTVMGVFELVRSGLGVGALPCYLAEGRQDLICVDGPDDDCAWDLWLLAHPDVRRSARVHAFFDYASSAIVNGFSSDAAER